MSNPMHHTLAKDRIEALLRRAEMDRMAQECLDAVFRQRVVHRVRHALIPFLLSWCLG